jgi:hypothetical protein
LIIFAKGFCAVRRTNAARIVVPPSLDPVEPVQLQSGEELTWEERRKRITDALEGLAAVRAFRDIDDPVAWQREIRKDRLLPGRKP